MNRTIKFIETKTGFYESFQNVNYLDAISDYVVQWETALKDKHGREIFEGDILLISDQYAECPDNTFAPVQYKDGAFLWDDEPLLEAAEYGEIIGNIFDNPELLKQ